VLVLHAAMIIAVAVCFGSSCMCCSSRHHQNIARLSSLQASHPSSASPPCSVCVQSLPPVLPMVMSRLITEQVFSVFV
jgi:hypothetical protein